MASCFEIIAEGKIAEHFEERVVAAGVADVFEIVVLAAGADAFLRSGGAGVVALFQAEEDFLELVHASVGEEQSWVIGRHKRGAAHDAVALTGEVFEELRASFISSHDSSPVSQRRGSREAALPAVGLLGVRPRLMRRLGVRSGLWGLGWASRVIWRAKRGRILRNGMG